MFDPRADRAEVFVVTASIAIGMCLSPSTAARVNRAVAVVVTASIAAGMYPSLPIPLAREQDDGG